MTRRLIEMGHRYWPRIDGSLAASHDTDPMDLPLDRFLNLIYWWLTQEGSEDEVRKFDTRLWQPPKGVAPAPSSPWSPEAETAAFASFAKALRPSSGEAPLTRSALPRGGG